VHAEAWTKVSVVLFDRQIKRLDRAVRDLNGSNSERVTRASLIRSLIDGLIEPGPAIKGGISDAALRRAFANILRTPGGKGAGPRI
jgi:hypothetical protein